ncbi:cadherin-17 [Solea senegalensis]|uniref:Cadherin-17 n=1 Tax=Solea senegalensis TaxID=28829 RepID=A0AAV6PXS1_SOLSE|nr:cadherin-17 [Solea senegalensis]KAG7476020.1 cadherin-17 [Solea senegalensis]
MCCSVITLWSHLLDLPGKAVIMTSMVHLLLLPLLLSIAGGKDLEEKKGPFEDTMLDVPEGTPVPYPMHQFQMTHPDVNNFRLSGEEKDVIKMSTDGWLYLEKPLDWSKEDHYIIKVEALAGDQVVDGPIFVTINVLDINNNAPSFNQTYYTALIRENSAAGVPFTRVFASDLDDPETTNAHLTYSLVNQFPNTKNIILFQINPNTGEISTTEEGAKMLKARESIHYSRGEDRSLDALKTKFNEYCPGPKTPYEENPFFTCVERAEVRRRSMDPLNDPDYTLFVRVQDLGGASESALSGNTRVHIIVQPNLWVNPGPISITENLDVTYPLKIAEVQSNDPEAIYSLVQKERELKFPFQITEDGKIFLTEALDREDKDMYNLVVFAKDINNMEVDPPMEIHVSVEDVNDNAPQCENEESVFEVQENEPVGSLIGQLLVHDNDKAGTLNSQLIYTITSLSPPSESSIFSIDAASGKIQALRTLQRKEQQVYHLDVQVNDPGFSVTCKVVIKVIDVNNEMPLFEETDYGSHTLAEDTPVGHTVVTIRATDADDPDSGSSLIEYHISAGDDDEVFAVETDGKGVGHLIIAKPLDFESSATYKLQIDARNPEPLMKGLEYGPQSSTSVTVSVTDVDEPPQFSGDVWDVTVPEDITKGSVLLTVEATDPEGKEISFKIDGDTRGWLEIDAATGQIKTKENLDRESLENIEITVTAFEKENPEMSSEHAMSVNLLDVNDNYPKLTETQAFICAAKPESIIIKAKDGDSAPFSQPFTFALSRKSPNWDLRNIDGSTAKLTLKKTQSQDKTFTLSIDVKDNAGMGIPQSFEVRVCNCTELGYCYVAPEVHSFKYGMGTTIGILVGTLGFCILAFVIVINRINKSNKEKKKGEAEVQRPMI